MAVNQWCPQGLSKALLGNGFSSTEGITDLMAEILNGVGEPVFIKDGEHRWRFVNRAFCQLFGYDAEGLLGKSEWDFWPAVAEQCLRVERQVIDGGGEQRHEQVLTDIQGNEHVVVIKVGRLPAAATGFLMGTVQDISEQRRSEEMLRQQAERDKILGAMTQLVLQSLSPEQMLQMGVNEVRRFLKTDRAVFFSFDPDYQGIVAESVEPGVDPIGDSGLAQMPLPAKDVAGYHQGFLQIVDDINTVSAANLQLKALQIRAYLVIPIVRGEELYGLVCAYQCHTPRHWQNWEIDTLQEVATEIGAAIKQARLYKQVKQLNDTLEQQIDQRSEQLQTALQFEATLKRITDRVRDSLDEEQIMLTAVQEVTEALGVRGSNASLYDLKEGTSKIYYEYNRCLPSYQGRVAQMEAFPEVYKQLLRGQYFQFCSQVPNPVRGRVSMLACPILDDRKVLGDLWLINDEGYGFDEMEIRLVQQVANQCAIAIRQAHLYQAAQMQVEQLERLNQLKDDFLSTVSHELRTPVTSMRVALQLLGVHLNREIDLEAELHKPKLDQKPVARYYQILQEECEREISLVNDLLDLQRLDVGNHPVNPEPVVLATWLPKLFNGFTPRTRQRDQSLAFTLSDEALAIHTDLASLERVFAELLNNACKYTPPGETIQLQVTPLGSGANAQVQFKLTNTGVEIPPEELTRIFDKFYRVPSADPWKQGGTGLGLALVDKLVRYIGGEIRVDSGQGKTSFTILLPLHLTAPSPENRPRIEAEVNDIIHG